MVATIQHTDPVIVLLTIDGETVETTADHPFYTEDGEWVDAADLEPGDDIRTLDGDTGEVEAVLFLERTQPMYNLTVDEAHTFFVGAGQWLVHNTGGTCDTIDPETVRFSQDSASHKFKDGRTIDELVEGLENGTINPRDVPSIRLVKRDGNLYTLDNRRLEAFRRAGIEIPYRMATPEEIAAEGWKFTTKNKGVSIRIRGKSKP